MYTQIDDEFMARSMDDVRGMSFPTLTRRESMIAVALSTGFKNSEIAKELGISVKTVDTHRLHILKKLELRNNVELARFAIREGYVQA